jgi:phasin family protein
VNAALCSAQNRCTEFIKQYFLTLEIGENNMANPTVELFNEYNAKALEAMRAFGDLSVANAQAFVNKQVELSNTIIEASLATSKEIAAAKTPVDAMQASSALVQNLTDTMTGYVKDSAADAVKARDELKDAIDSSVKLNSEYAQKAFDNGVETVKKTAKKAS